VIFRNAVVVACGRSGTRYASVVLSKLGMGCGHQRAIKAQKPGIPAKLPVPAESSAFAAPYVMDIPESWLIIHQVRHPLKVVESLIRLRHLPSQNNQVGNNFYAKHAPSCKRYDRHADQALALWIAWNVLILKAEKRQNYRRHRLEDGAEPWERYCVELGLTWKPGIFKQVRTNEGSSGNPQPIGWDAFRVPLLVNAAKTLAVQFGYTTAP